MQIHDHFDVAHLVGHTAFDHLNSAGRVYEEVRNKNYFDPSQYAWPDCLSIGGQVSIYRDEERKSCVQAVILFQAMMEKAIYFVPTVGSGLNSAGRGSFATKWRNLISQIRDNTDRANATAAFVAYDNDIYNAFRNPIVHGSTASDVQQIEKIRMPDVYEGVRQGWRAYDYLLTEAFAPEQSHEPSWDTMCGAHAIPNSLNLSNYPDLTDLSCQFYKRHLDGAREAAGSE